MALFDQSLKRIYAIISSPYSLRTYENYCSLKKLPPSRLPVPLEPSGWPLAAPARSHLLLIWQIPYLGPLWIVSPLLAFFPFRATSRWELALAHRRPLQTVQAGQRTLMNATSFVRSRFLFFPHIVSFLTLLAKEKVMNGLAYLQAALLFSLL